MSHEIKQVVGDLFSGRHARTIAHGCNAHGVMGAGVAGIVSKRWPYAYQQYADAVANNEFVGGSAQFVGIGWPFIPPGEDTNGIEGIYNLCTQIKPGPNADPWLIKLAITNMAQHAVRSGITEVGIPRIGCGIGGLQWKQVYVYIRAGLTDAPALQDGRLTVIVHDLPTSTPAPLDLKNGVAA